eukprot:TCALIF_10368-PA protein Name:"Protein of unknown function" AED:0.19 eAED:0.19 QI:145/1/0.66/1/1/0.66/3/0/759
MYQKIDKTQKRSVSSKPTTALDVSITDLISECEDYVKTEEFTKDLSVKILEMFQNERNKFKNNEESVYSVISAKSEPIYSNVPQLVDHYSEVDKSNPSIGVPRLRLGSPHNNFCVLEPHYSKPVDHQNIYEQIDQFNQTPRAPQKPERLVPNPIKSNPELEPKFPCPRESIYENEVASYQDLPSIITHEASPMDSLPSENSSSAHDSAYESENKPMIETREPPKRPTFPGSYYENFSGDSCARVPPVPVPPQFQDESPTANPFELDDPCSTMKRNPHFTPPEVPKRDSSRRFAGQARFASLPRSLDSLSSSKVVGSSDLDQTCLGETDVVNPISLVFEDLNEYLSDSDGMLSLDYKIAVQKRRNRLRNLAEKQCLSGNGNSIQDQRLSPGTKTVEYFADNEQPIIKMGPSQQLVVADNAGHNNSPSRVKKVVEQIQRKYPQGPTKPVERSRSRRSPSVASECSTLEPIPEEIPGQVYAARVTKPLSIPSPKFYSLPRGGKGFQSKLDDVKENVTDQSHAAIFDTLIQSRRTESPSRFIEFPNGTLKQRKALKTASLTSLLIKDDNKSQREPPTFSSSFQENPLAKCSSFQELSNIFGSTQSLVPSTPRRLDPMAKNWQTKKWVSEVNLGMRAWTPNQVVVKECSCGNKVQFDPMEECSTLGYPTDSETNLEMSDYGSFDRRNGLFYAKPAETVNGSDDDDPTQDDLTPPPAFASPPPRPPPPVLLFNRLGSLKRSQSLNMSQPQRHLQGWNSIPTLSQS